MIWHVFSFFEFTGQVRFPFDFQYTILKPTNNTESSVQHNTHSIQSNIGVFCFTKFLVHESKNVLYAIYFTQIIIKIVVCLAFEEN